MRSVSPAREYPILRKIRAHTEAGAEARASASQFEKYSDEWFTIRENAFPPFYAQFRKAENVRTARQREAERLAKLERERVEVEERKRKEREALWKKEYERMEYEKSELAMQIRRKAAKAEALENERRKREGQRAEVIRLNQVAAENASGAKVRFNPNTAHLGVFILNDGSVQCASGFLIEVNGTSDRRPVPLECLRKGRLGEVDGACRGGSGCPSQQYGKLFEVPKYARKLLYNVADKTPPDARSTAAPTKPSSSSTTPSPHGLQQLGLCILPRYSTFDPRVTEYADRSPKSLWIPARDLLLIAPDSLFAPRTKMDLPEGWKMFPELDKASERAAGANEGGEETGEA